MKGLAHGRVSNISYFSGYYYFCYHHLYLSLCAQLLTESSIISLSKRNELKLAVSIGGLNKNTEKNELQELSINLADSPMLSHN